MPDAADTKAGETSGQWNGTAGTTSTNSSSSKNDGSKGGSSSGTGGSTGSSESKSQTSNSEAKTSAPSGTSKSTPSTATSKGITSQTPNSEAKSSAPKGTSVSKPATANPATAYKGTTASNSVKVTDPSRAPQSSYNPLSSTGQNLNPFGGQPVGNLPTLNQVSPTLQNPVSSLQQAIGTGLPQGSVFGADPNRQSSLADMPNVQSPMNMGLPGSLRTDYQNVTKPAVGLSAYGQPPQAPKIADRLTPQQGPVMAPGYGPQPPQNVGMSYTPGLPGQMQPPQFAQSGLPLTSDPRRTQLPGPTAYMGLPPGLEPRKTAGFVDQNLRPPDQIVAQNNLGRFAPGLPAAPAGRPPTEITIPGGGLPVGPGPQIATAGPRAGLPNGGFPQAEIDLTDVPGYTPPELFNPQPPAQTTVAGDPRVGLPTGGFPPATTDVAENVPPGGYSDMPYTDPNFEVPQIDIPYGGGPPGKKAPSQADGQPQDLGELANRYDYEKGRARDGLRNLPGDLLSAIMGGNISAGTDLAGLQGLRGGGSQGSGLYPQPSAVPVAPTDVFSMIAQLNQAGYSPEQQMKLIMSTFV